ncbi:MAG: hypothetical protein WC621_04100 [Patescibacteria group bacterium]
MPEFQCEICKLKYKDNLTARQCYEWCRQHDSCNWHIASQAINKDEAEKQKLNDKRYNEFNN